MEQNNIFSFENFNGFFIYFFNEYEHVPVQSIFKLITGKNIEEEEMFNFIYMARKLIFLFPT